MLPKKMLRTNKIVDDDAVVNKKTGKGLDEDSDDNDEDYEIERIIDKRRNRGKTQYLIKWRHYPSSENTWEPEENVNAANLIDEFEKTQKAANVESSPKKRRGNSRPLSQRSNGSKGDESDDDEVVLRIDNDEEDEFNEGGEDQEGDEDEVYEIQKIIDKRTRRGVVQYLVKWKNYPHSENTWEPIGNLGDEAILEYEKTTKKEEPTSTGGGGKRRKTSTSSIDVFHTPRKRQAVKLDDESDRASSEQRKRQSVKLDDESDRGHFGDDLVEVKEKPEKRTRSMSPVKKGDDSLVSKPITMSPEKDAALKEVNRGERYESLTEFPVVDWKKNEALSEDDVDDVVDCRQDEKGMKVYLARLNSKNGGGETWVAETDTRFGQIFDEYEKSALLRVWMEFDINAKGKSIQITSAMETGDGLMFKAEVDDPFVRKWISNAVARQICPQALLNFYEGRIHWHDS